MPNLLTLVFQLAIIIAASAAVASLFQKIGQPKVIGEMFAGIMLGPSLLGWLAPGLSATIFPPASLGYLSALSQVGIIIYMFLVGVSINPAELKKHGHTVVLVSHVSIIAPFVLGCGLALYLYPRLSDDSVGFVSFGLFVGAAMSITAFPVLARILAARNLLGTKIGSLAIACAAVDDVTGWCVLAYIVFLTRAHEATATSLWITIGGLGLFVFLMLSAGRRALRRFETSYRTSGSLGENSLAVMMLLVLLSALITEHLGLHLLFGAFLAGVVMPKEPEFVRYVTEKFQTVTVTLLLPLYFAFTGLRTSIGLIDGAQMWLICLAIIALAIVGKLGGSMIAARWSGNSWSESAALGTLMNTRGLMELVILNIGLDIGVISGTLYSMMVLMALTTTFMTAPLFEWFYRMERREETIPERATGFEPATKSLGSSYSTK